MSFKRCGIAVMMFATIASAARLEAFELAAGVSAIDEMDDRPRPAAMAQLGFTDSWFIRGYIWGQTFGPIAERSSMFSANYRFPAWQTGKAANFSGHLGLVGLLEETTYDPHWDDDDTTRSTPAEADEEKKTTAAQFNAGMALGISYTVPIRPAYLSFSWDGHLFPAGWGFVFLSTGRKQAVSVALGLAL